MNKNKEVFLLSLAIGLLGGIGLLSISKLSGENISVFFQNTEGLCIFTGTIISFFIASFVLIQFLYKTSTLKKLLIIPFVAIVALGYYSFESGSFYTWKRALLVRSNPYDGLYTFDPSRIKSEHIRKSVKYGQQRNSSPLTLIIDKQIATLYGYQWNAPAINREFNVCFENGLMLLRNGSQSSDYCEFSPEGRLELSFKPDGDGKLVCSNCEEAFFPSHWTMALKDWRSEAK